MSRPPNISEALLALEERLLDPMVRVSPSEVDELLADDFCEIGSSGRVYDKSTMLEELQKDPGFDQPPTVVDFLARELSSSVVLVTYRIRETGTLRSSVWRNSGGRWRMVFHQGTRRAT